MAHRTFEVFKNCVRNGVPDTAMEPKNNVTDAEIEAVYKWLQQYK